MNHLEQRASLISEAQALLNKPYFTKESKSKFDSLMAMADAIGLTGDNFRRAQAAGLVAENVDEPAEAEFRKFVRTGSAITSKELRTYSPLSEGNASALIPTKWKQQYQARLVSASGLLRAGATIVSDVEGKPYKSFYSDDQANEASIIAENTQITNANPVMSVTSPTVVKFSTATQVTNELLQDAAYDLDAFLQGLFARRVARKFNNWATTDATNGVLAQFTVGGTSSSTSTPSLGDLVQMQSPDQIDPEYLEADSQPVYMMSPVVRTLLMQTIASDGRRMYPEIAQGQLLGFPLVLNVDMPSSAGSVAVTFGSIKRAVLVQDTITTLVRSKELFAEYFRTGFFFSHRIGVKVSDVNAVTALQLAS
jgi:HK97 family phage major capsid protein